MIDFPTILYTSDREFFTLWFNWCLKGDTFQVDPPCIGHYREYSEGSYKSLYFVILSLVECGNCLTYQKSANHINTSTWSSYIVTAIFSCFSSLTGIESESVYPLSFKYIQNIIIATRVWQITTWNNNHHLDRLGGEKCCRRHPSVGEQQATSSSNFH